MTKKDYNEYRVVFQYRPGTDKNPPEYVFVELENEHGEGVGGHDWAEMDGSLVALVLPIYKVIDPEQDKAWKETEDFHRDDILGVN